MRRASAVLVATVISVCAVAAQTGTGEVGTIAQELKRLSLEELAQLDITSVSRRPQKLSETAAAVAVIRADDLRRAGVTNLAEAMRLGDGLDVARVNPNTWAISARGFQISTANKLLVLVDGRSVYSPLFAGTFWEVQELVFDDIDRIEIVRGPGGATWGANAMNGVVNVITRPAEQTRGTFAMVTAGTDEHAIVSGRHGARAGRWGDYRVYGKFRQRNAGINAVTGSDEGSGLLMGHAGFRLDSDGNRAARWSFQGEMYKGSIGLVGRPDGDLGGGNFLARLARRSSAASEFSAQFYYDRTSRKIPLQFEETRDTVDLRGQQRLVVAGRHDMVFGADARVSHGNDRGIAGFFFEPAKRTDTLFSAFVQDEFGLGPRGLFLIAGSKFERNDFTGFEVQPTVRLRWTRTDRHTLWGAVSRAVRLPTRFDTDLRIVNPITRQVLISGTDSFDAESVVAYEAGYRIRPYAPVALDIATFVNRYDDLRSQELPRRAGEPVTLRNLLNAATAGLELAATVQAAEHWRVHGSYTYLHERFSVDPQSTDPFEGSFEANDPSHAFALRSYWDLPKGLQFDGVLRAVSARPRPRVPAYAELNLRLGWMVRAGWEVSLAGQNLLHDRHTEFASQGAPQYEFRRAAYLKSAWRF